MKLFVFDDVLCDYTGGMALIAANDIREAQEYTYYKFRQQWNDETFQQFMDREKGWQQPILGYDVDNVDPGVHHACWGGG